MGIENLPKAKWSTAGRQVILKADFIDIEDAILSQGGGGGSIPPALAWIDATSVKIAAVADSPANILMSGFPNILHPGSFIAGTSDRKYRTNTSDTVMDFDVPASLWGTEKVSQWHIIYGIAADEDAAFTLKAMPFMRVKSQATQTISLGNLTTPATGIGYGFTTDELIDASIYMISGASNGLLRTISANNNNNATGGTVTYTGDALTVAEGDWFVVLPNTNFRFLGSIFNNSSGDIQSFYRFGDTINFIGYSETFTITGAGTWSLAEAIPAACPLASESWIFNNDNAAGIMLNHPNLLSLISTFGAIYIIPDEHAWVPIQNCTLSRSASTGIPCYSLGYKYPAGSGF